MKTILTSQNSSIQIGFAKENTDGTLSTTLSDGVASDVFEFEKAIRLFTTTSGIKCSIAETPSETNYFTLSEGENWWGIQAGQKVAVYGGDVEMVIAI